MKNKIKIKKRFWANPIGSSGIWLIPTFTFIMLNSFGMINSDKIWVWLLGIPLVITLWFFINFKIEK